MANREEKKAVINPAKRGRNGNAENWFTALKNSTKAANEIEGIPRRNENLVASFLFHPDKRAIEIGVVGSYPAVPIKIQYRLCLLVICTTYKNLFQQR